MLLVKEFAAKIGLLKLVRKLFKTNGLSNDRTHTDPLFIKTYKRKNGEPSYALNIQQNIFSRGEHF